MNTDTERLEFLCGNPDTQGYYMVMGEGDNWCVWDQSNGLTKAGTGATLREAIDQAMSKQNV